MKLKTTGPRLEDGHVYLMPVTFILLLLAPAISAITIALHPDEPVFQVQNWIFVMFASAWLVFVPRVRFVTEAAFGGWTMVAIHVLACTVAVLAVQTIIAYYLRPVYLVQPLFVYLFYINAAISEESLFRVFLCTFIIIAVTAIPVRKQYRMARRAIAMMTAIAASGIVFSLSHLGVYAEVPLMLLSTLIGGTIMAAFLVITKNPLVPIVAHVANNAIAAGVIITNCILQAI